MADRNCFGLAESSYRKATKTTLAAPANYQYQQGTISSSCAYRTTTPTTEYVLDLPLWGSNHIKYQFTANKVTSLYFKSFVDSELLHIGDLAFINGLLNEQYVDIQKCENKGRYLVEK